MNRQEVSVMEAIRHARHDFLNQLQIIKMNIDLGKVEEAKDAIHRYTEMMRMYQRLSKLKLPQFVEWLHTVQWLHSDWETYVSESITISKSISLDEEIVHFISSCLDNRSKQADPLMEQIAKFHVQTTEQQFQFHMLLIGKWKDTYIPDGNWPFFAHMMENTKEMLRIHIQMDWEE